MCSDIYIQQYVASYYGCNRRGDSTHGIECRLTLAAAVYRSKWRDVTLTKTTHAAALGAPSVKAPRSEPAGRGLHRPSAAFERLLADVGGNPDIIVAAIDVGPCSQKVRTYHHVSRAQNGVISAMRKAVKDGSKSYLFVVCYFPSNATFHRSSTFGDVSLARYL